MTILFYILLIVGLIANAKVTRWGLASRIWKLGTPLNFMSNPYAYYFVNALIFVLLITLSFPVKFPFWVIPILYLITYYISKVRFWKYLLHEFQKMEKDGDLNDEDGNPMTPEESIKQFKEGQKVHRELEKLLKK